MTDKRTKRVIFTEMLTIPIIADNPEYIELLQKEIDAIDRKNEKAKARRAEKTEKVDLLLDKVEAILTEEFQSISDIVTALNDEFSDLTNSKIVPRLTKLYKAGKIEKEIQKIDGRRVSCYRKIVETE